jgi:hypothetical protein
VVEMENSCRILFGGLEWRLRHIKEDNIKMVFLKIGCQDMNWTDLKIYIFCD